MLLTLGLLALPTRCMRKASGRTGPSPCSCPMRRAATPTWSRRLTARYSRSRWANPSSSRTAPAPAASSERRLSPMRRPMATRSASAASAPSRSRRSRRRSAMIRRRIWRRSASSAPSCRRSSSRNPADQFDGRARRLRQGQSRQAQLRLERRRRPDALLRRAVRSPHRHPDGAHPVQGRRARDRRR